MDKETRTSFIQMGYAASVGIAMVLSIFGGLLIGVYLDRKLDSGYVFTFLFLVIGIIAGFRNIYVLIKKSFTFEKTVITRIKNEQHRKRPSPQKN